MEGVYLLGFVVQKSNMVDGWQGGAYGSNVNNFLWALNPHHDLPNQEETCQEKWFKVQKKGSLGQEFSG